MQATNLKEVKEVQGVLRDANGTFTAAAYNYIEHVVDAPTAEVHALREGLLLAQHI